MKASSRPDRGFIALTLVLALLVSLGGVPAAAGAPVSAPATCSIPVFVNEFHYDNDGTDTGEFIEVAGPAGTDLAGWTLVLYNGNGGAVYGTLNLTGAIPDQSGNGFGTLSFAAAGLQNGSPDGFALVNASNVVQQFLSYEGTFVAVGGPANGMTSVDVGVSQPSTTPIGQSLLLIGSGECPENFTWTGPAPWSPGTINPGQSFATGDVAPVVVDTTPDNGAMGVPPNTNVDVTFSEPVTLAGTVAIACTSGTQNVTPTGGPTTFVLPHTAFAPGDGCTVTILASQVTDQDGTPTPMAADYIWGFEVASGCFTASTPVHDIQGTGPASPLQNQTHSVEALVVADYQGVSSIRGFFVEEPDADHDADPATSEGLFIYDGNLGVPVAVGDYVRVTGTVTEFQNQTQLGSSTTSPVTSVIVCPTNPLAATPANATLPFPDTAYPERFEGMSVAMTQTLTVNETFNLGRGGILTLSNGRLQQPTNVVLPGGPAGALQAANNRNQITLDDSSLTQNPDPIVYPPPGLAALNTVRSGDSVSNLAGVLTQGNPGWTTPGNIYRINPFSMPAFTATNPRPAAPNPVRASGSLKVSSSNVLNYFLTLDVTTTTGPCGPSQNQECRGANTAFEFTRQRDKLLQALYILNADIVGLMELENTPNVEPLADLVNGLNALAGAGTYDYIATGTIIPGDVIKVGLIYKPGVVQPVGDFAILNSLVDPTFSSGNRPALAQTFEEIATHGRFTVIVNHLKSKGCTGATGLDTDQGDGQSCFNYTRTLAANALVTWALSDPTGSGDPDFMILGDLNAYAKEDPMAALETAGGYTNLETLFVGPNAYSYVFSAQAGSLDHSMANAPLTPQISGATTWHINADEPTVLDYNTEFKSAGQIVSLFNADAYRVSDHDPLLIGLNLIPAEASIVVTKTVGTTPGICAATDDITVPAGADVYYCYAVANTGNLTLYLHDLEDSELGPIFASLPYTLTPGSSVNTVAAGLEISATINATTVNTALWTSYNAGPIDVVTATATATVTVLIPPPNIFVDPLDLSSTQATNTTTQQTLTISNTGGSALMWSIFEDVSGSPDMVDWSDNFDSYATGSQLAGQGGWQGWDGVAAAGALTSGAQAHSTPNSAAILGASDLVHQYSGYTSGQWVYTTWQYVPTNFTGQSYVILLNTYTDGGPYNWSTQLCFDAATDLVYDTTGTSCTGTSTLPLVYDQWVEIRVEIDLNANTQAVYYNNQLLFQDTWTDHVSGGGSLNIAALDLFANNASTVYYDDLSLAVPAQPVACDAPANIPWASASPTNGTTSGGWSTPVTVTFDSTGLANGTYTGNLCITSNDPDPGPGNGTDLVIVPLTLTVQPPTAVTMGGLTANTSQSPVPANMPLAALPVAAGLAMAAVYALRRKR